MLKLIFCLHRLPSLSPEAFRRYWLEEHGPLVRQHAAVLRIARYVQSHGLGGPLDEALRASRGAPEAYDGVAELWWKSAEDFAAATASAEGRAASLALLEDERRFIDLARSPLFVVEERALIP